MAASPPFTTMIFTHSQPPATIPTSSGSNFLPSPKTMTDETLTLESLHVLVSLYETRRLSKTAAALAIPDSVASRRLSSARRVLDDPLFIRSATGFIPTARMLALLPRMRRVLADLVALQTKDDPFSPEHFEKVIRIMTADSGILLFLLSVVRRLRDIAPGVEFEIQPLAADMFERLKRGDTDFLIMPRSEIPNDYSQLPLRTLPVVLLARPDNPVLATKSGNDAPTRSVTSAELARLNVIEVDPTCGLSGFNFRFHHLNDIRPAIRLPYFCAAPFLISAPEDVVLLPEDIAQTLSQGTDLRIFRLSPQIHAAYTPHLIWHQRIHTDPAMQWVRAQIHATSHGLVERL